MLATWGCTTFPKPTLSLDFLGATSLDSGITFSRGSQATLFDSTGTLVYAKHNLLLQSQDFATTWGVLRASISTDATTAPNGTVTADKLVEDTTASNTHIVRQIGLTIASATPYLFSVYLKAGERTKALLQTTNTGFSNNAYVIFDLIAGTVVANVSATSAAIVDVGNGWYRCSMGNTSTGTAGNLTIGLVDAANNPSYTGDGTSGLFLWGAQLNIANMEGGVTSSLTTYYPTTTAAYYAPRFDYNPSTLQPRGLLIEEQRTNSIRNNTMQGAVAGTPGTLPTNWFASNTGTGLTFSVVGTGTENGITYIDLRYQGTATSGGTIQIFSETATAVVATSGQTWTSSGYWKIAAGSATGLSGWAINTQELNAAGGFLAQTVTAVTAPTTAALNTQRPTATVTLGNASTARTYFSFLANYSNGAAIDITLRIGLPQMELGAFATSVIPTTTTALTRNADVASMTGTNFSSWFNAAGIGTLFAQAASRSTSTANALITQIDSGSSADIFGIYHQVDEQAVFRVRIGNVNIFGTGFGTLTDGVVAKTAAAFQSGSNAACLNGGTVVSNTTSFSAPTMSVLRIGTNQISTESINGWVQRLAYYPVRLQASQLQALTA